ncbi:MAG: D-alanyl-D-alanine carboxypeptidase family protein [Bacilli bacterium]|nr:D-alanyl-D-alanine carboxypeptidase family protein [Bacilli bacterium]
MKKVILIIMLLFVTGCNKEVKKEVTYKEKITIKIGEEVPSLEDYITSDYCESCTIEWTNIELEDNKVYVANTYEGILKIGNKDVSVNLEVIDDEAPSINNIKDITITAGDKVDLLKDITATDNSKDEIDLSISEDSVYDLNKAGTYNIEVIAKDSSDNSAKETFKLIVKEKVIPKEEVVDIPNVPDVDLSGTTTKGYQINRIDGIYYINGILIANKTYALPSTYNPGGLRSEFMTAFNKMKEAAKADGVTITIISGYRSYSYQKALYDGYVKTYGKAMTDTFSARPGNSEHQSGLAADLNRIDDNFGNTKEGKWLDLNASKYGFILRYPKGKQSITGYKYEPWHFRYIGDEATNLYQNGEWTTLEEYLGIDSKYQS